MDRVKDFFFQNQSVKQTIIKNIVWLSGGVTVSRALRALMLIYAARVLGPVGNGIFSYALSLAGVFTFFSDIGLSALLTRELVKRSGDRDYLATSLILKVGLVGLTTLFIGFISPFFTSIPEVKPLMIIMAGLVAFDSIRGFLFSISRSENRMQFESAFEIITEILITGAGLFVLFNFPTVSNFALGYVLASGAALLCLVVAMRKYFSDIFTRFKKELVVTILYSAWPFAIIGVFGIFMTNIDSVILGFFRGAADVGLLAAAQKPVTMLYVIPGFLYATLFPFFSQFVRDKEKDKLTILVRKSVIISIGLALPIVLGGLLVATALMNVVFGPEYRGAVGAFKILLLTLVPIFPGMILSSTLLAEDKRGVFIKSSLAGAAVNVVLDIILIFYYGLIGSAIASLFAHLTVNTIFLRELAKNHDLNIWHDMRKIFLALLVMLVCVYIMVSLSLPLLLIIPLAAVIYFGLLFLLKEKIIKEIRAGFQSEAN